MNKTLKLVFVAILLFSIYHFLRDVLQTFDIHSLLTNIGHRPHEWCGQYCNVVTWPLDIAGVVISVVVLKRNKVGVLGIVLLLSLPLWVVFSLLP